MDVFYLDKSFWNGRKVFITGHTGFKGTWLAFILKLFGADVTGFALEPPTHPNLFSLIKLEKIIRSVKGDIRNFNILKEVFDECRPEVVFHLAAQPIVIEGYKNPMATYETNVMGTVNILECIRQNSCVKSFLNITTDKVYHNNEWPWGYRENDTLNGLDPYSNSKSCSEIITACYCRSFFSNGKVAISTARAGNVIGGGDFADFRIIPDCVRAALENKKIFVRNSNSVRPYQHVLDPLFAYIMIAEKQCFAKKVSGCYNVGPNENDCVTTGELVEIFCKAWGGGLSWENLSANLPKEANFLKLDCSKIKATFGWSPRWDIFSAVEKTVDWTKIYQKNGNLAECMEKQLKEFLGED